MAFLVLAHLGDDTALGVSAALRRKHGPEQVKLVSAEELVLAPFWAHRLDEPGVTTEVRLSDGTSVSPRSGDVVFNRLVAPPLPQYAKASPGDRDYASCEITALWLSWLASLRCPVVNPPGPAGLGAPALSQSEWLHAAGAAGLPIQAYQFTTDPRWTPVSSDYSPSEPGGDSEPGRRRPTVYVEKLGGPRTVALVAGSTVHGPLAFLFKEQLARLALATHCDLLRVTFGRSSTPSDVGAAGRGWKVVRCDPFPQGETTAGIDAIVHLLEEKAVGP